jgi:hypothetical protein
MDPLDNASVSAVGQLSPKVEKDILALFGHEELTILVSGRVPDSSFARIVDINAFRRRPPNARRSRAGCPRGSYGPEPLRLGRA